MAATDSRLRMLTGPFRRHPLVTKLLAGGVGLLVLLVVGTNAYVILSTDGEATGTIADVPDAEVAIVPGALVEADGRMSGMLADRVDQAVALWRAGKVERILVSGDHHTWGYDEPDTMRMAIQRQGVPGRDIFEDHAGFNTWATMVRARRIFEVSSAVIITQGFHMPRALFLADAAGLNATGLTSDLHPYGIKGTESDLREILARVKAVGDVATDSEVTGGPKIPISGDGRVSWGPAPPPGTPPAGAPRALASSG